MEDKFWDLYAETEAPQLEALIEAQKEILVSIERDRTEAEVLERRARRRDHAIRQFQDSKEVMPLVGDLIPSYALNIHEAIHAPQVAM
jgi:hypothetical protein